MMTLEIKNFGHPGVMPVGQKLPSEIIIRGPKT